MLLYCCGAGIEEQQGQISEGKGVLASEKKTEHIQKLFKVLCQRGREWSGNSSDKPWCECRMRLGHEEPPLRRAIGQDCV